MLRTPTGQTRTVLHRLGVVGLAAAALASSCALAGPAVAQTSPPPSAPAAEAPPTTSTSVAKERTAQQAAIVDAAIRLYRIRADLADVQKALADTTVRLAEAEQVLAETERKLTQARTELVELRSRLQARAAIVYQRHSDRLGMALSVDRVVDLSAGNHYAESVATVDNGEIDRLEGVVSNLETQRNQQDAARRDLVDLKAKQDRQQADLQAVVDKESAEIDKLGGVPIMGSAILSGVDIAAWFKSTGQRARLMGTTTIDELAEMYVSEGAAENVRGDIAFAQAVLETGSFGHATDNNFAGIGACDSCTSQFLFATPLDGVRGQIQLLLNYADPNSRAARLKNPLDATLHGTDPVRAAITFDTFSFKGRAPVWNIMGNGNWATDPLYAGKVLNIYSKMLAFKTGQPR